jgi:hypothetical protein
MTQEEEIIDLTEVVEEAGGTAAPGVKPVLETETKGAGDISGVGKPVQSALADAESAVQALQEAMTARAEKWLSHEGQQIVDQGARAMIPRIAAEALGKEVEEMRAEVEKIGAQKEALFKKTEEWMAVEGTRVLERVAREMFPGIAAEVLRQEIEKIKMEVEEKA